MVVVSVVVVTVVEVVTVEVEEVVVLVVVVVTVEDVTVVGVVVVTVIVLLDVDEPVYLNKQSYIACMGSNLIIAGFETCCPPSTYL